MTELRVRKEGKRYGGMCITKTMIMKIKGIRKRENDIE